jgi:hypothetical protein
MQRFFAMVLSCALLLVSSGFANSHNRFDKKTYLPQTPKSHATPTRNIHGRNPNTGLRMGSANARPNLAIGRTLKMGNSNGVRR